MSDDGIAGIVSGIIILFILVALVYVIIRRIKEKKDEDFEDRPW